MVFHYGGFSLYMTLILCSSCTFRSEDYHIGIAEGSSYAGRSNSSHSILYDDIRPLRNPGVRGSFTAQMCTRYRPGTRRGDTRILGRTCQGSR